MIFTTFKKTVMLAIFVMASINAIAVPAKRVWRTVTLTDGRQIEAMLVGDEHGHWLVDRNGKALVRNEQGKAYYLTDSQLAERKQKRNERAARSNALRVQKIVKTRALSAKAAAKAPRKTVGVPTTVVGKHKGIVILVNFSDKSLKDDHNQTLYNRRFNEVGFNEDGHIGSVHDYFYDQSYGMFDLEFDVVGPVTVSKAHDYYGENDKDGNDKHAASLVIEAVKLADEQGVDFSKYDWDDDGYVDQVFVIYAGTGEAVSQIENEIWPHEYELSAAKQYMGDGSGKQYIDGKYIDTYAVSCELANETTIDGIGTACHEFSHCLGYTDLYDSDYSGGQGMMYWDLLDAGSYNGPNDHGEVPAAYTSFERWWAGWMEPTVLDKPQNIKDMPALNDEPVAYKIVNDAHPDEYYLLENRQAKRWDSYTAGYNNGRGHGMLILHVDYDEAVWKENAANDDPKRQRMTYFPADNSYGTYLNDYGQWTASLEQLAGDPFPGTSKNTSFTDTSVPAATLYNANAKGKKYMSKPVTDISEANGLISFTFMGGWEVPETQSVVAQSPTSFTATWNVIDEASSYTVRAIPYIPKTADKGLILSETFSKASGDTSEDISESLDSYFDNMGWQGNKVYPASEEGGIKMSSSSNNGALQSPALSPSSKYLTVVLSAKKYNSDQSSIRINRYLQDENQLQQVDKYSPSSSYQDHVISFAHNGASSIRFIFSKRSYVKSIKIYDGKFTEQDIIDASSANPHDSDTISHDTIYVEGVTDTSYTFNNLTASQYIFQAKAIYPDGNESSWSDEMVVSLDATSITDIITDAVSSDTRIYNINGQLLGTNLQQLPKGIYIQRGRKVIKR